MRCFCKKRNKIAACTIPQATCNRKCARVFEQGSEEFSLYPCAPHRTWVTPSLKSVSQLATHTLDQFQRYKQTEKSWPIELGSLKQTVLVSAFYSRCCKQGGLKTDKFTEMSKNLNEAAMAGNLEEVLLRLNLGEDVNQMLFPRYSTPLHDATTCGRIQIAKILIER